MPRETWSLQADIVGAAPDPGKTGTASPAGKNGDDRGFIMGDLAAFERGELSGVCCGVLVVAVLRSWEESRIPGRLSRSSSRTGLAIRQPIGKILGKK